MIYRTILPLTAALLACSLSYAEVGFGPWTLGMSKDEVKTGAMGPYTEKPDGSLETTNAEWGDRKVRAILNFELGKLSKVTLHLLAGADFESAVKSLWITNMALKNLHRIKAGRNKYQPQDGEYAGFLQAVKQRVEATPPGQTADLIGEQTDAPPGLKNLSVMRRTPSGTYEVQVVFAPGKA